MASNPATIVNSPEGASSPPAGTSNQRNDWMTALSRQLAVPAAATPGTRTPLSDGDRASLRRLELKQSISAEAAVVKLLAAAGVPGHRQTQDFRRWRLIAHVAALLSGTAKLPAHAPYRNVGAVLKEIGYLETRLFRLLAARGDALHDQIIHATRMIAQRKRQPVDLWTIYHLLSSHPAKAEKARVEIAQAYYTATSSAQGDDK